MIISHLKLTNWRNFKKVDINLGMRTFLIGPNASGKSNFLDVFRFLRDIASQGGGLQKAVNDRGGVPKIRCLSARKESQIEIAVHIADSKEPNDLWIYAIGIKQQSRGYRQPFLIYERVMKNNQVILTRPNTDDRKDRLRLTQTHLEQINANFEFRKIADFFETIYYSHLVPQLLKYPDMFIGSAGRNDPFGRNFLEKVAKTTEKTRKSRLKKIEKALQVAVPHLKQLTDTKDERGIPHLEAVYEHWRPKAGKQREEEFSDGTLRLIGFLWAILESDSLLLLEEPELSLHSEIIRELPSLIWRIQSKKKRQVIISTHSPDLLSDKSIGGEEVLLLIPVKEGTKIEPASNDKDVKSLLESGMSIADAAYPKTKPKNVYQLSLFDE